MKSVDNYNEQIRLAFSWLAYINEEFAPLTVQEITNKMSRIKRVAQYVRKAQKELKSVMTEYTLKIQEIIDAQEEGGKQ